MIEHSVSQDTGLSLDDALVNSSTTAGQMLKQARLNAGLHIAALAVSLRVPVKRIEALESGQMDLLPDTVFVRALTSSICQALKIDAAPVLDKLPKAALPRLNRDDIALNTPIGVTGASKNLIWSDMLTSPWLMGVAFLCIASAGIYFWPNASSSAISEITTSGKSLPEVGVTQAKEQLVATERMLEVAASTVQIPSSSSALTPSSAAIITTASTHSDSSNLVVNTAPPLDSIVVFKASAETWVEVKNITGSTVFKKLLAAGETAGATGALPLTVIVGRADVTKVEVRGKQLDLTAIAKSNVARFEVN
jgi:cytoskeleton protein RodZ